MWHYTFNYIRERVNARARENSDKVGKKYEKPKSDPRITHRGCGGEGTKCTTTEKSPKRKDCTQYYCCGTEWIAHINENKNRDMTKHNYQYIFDCLHFIYMIYIAIFVSMSMFTYTHTHSHANQFYFSRHFVVNVIPLKIHYCINVYSIRVFVCSRAPKHTHTHSGGGGSNFCGVTKTETGKTKKKHCEYERE